jgi:hypothetical protein
METRMENYYWDIVSATGRFQTLQMLWWSEAEDSAND